MLRSQRQAKQRKLRKLEYPTYTTVRCMQSIPRTPRWVPRQCCHTVSLQHVKRGPLTGGSVYLQILFEQLLTEPALQLQNSTATNVFALASQVRFLVLKNYAAALSKNNSTCERALQLYVEAANMDVTDTVLWHNMGTLVCLLLVPLEKKSCITTKSSVSQQAPM